MGEKTREKGAYLPSLPRGLGAEVPCRRGFHDCVRAEAAEGTPRQVARRRLPRLPAGCQRSVRIQAGHRTGRGPPRALVHLPRAEARAKGRVVHQCAPVARSAGRREERLVTEPRQHVREDAVATAVQQGRAPGLGAGPRGIECRWTGSRHGTPAARAAREPAGGGARPRARRDDAGRGPGRAAPHGPAPPTALRDHGPPQLAPPSPQTTRPRSGSRAMRKTKNRTGDPLLGVRRGEGSRNPVSLK